MLKPVAAPIATFELIEGDVHALFVLISASEILLAGRGLTQPDLGHKVRCYRFIRQTTAQAPGTPRSHANSSTSTPR